MESQFQIGLIAPEADLELLMNCLLSDNGAEVEYVNVAARISWLSCSLTNPQTPALLTQTDAVIVGAKLDRERDASSLNSVLRMLQRNSQNILAVAVWGTNASQLVSLLDWNEVLISTLPETDRPPVESLRQCLIDNVNNGFQEPLRHNEAVVTKTKSTQLPAPVTRTLSAAQRNIGGRQVRDLSHLRQRAGGTGKSQTAPLRMNSHSQPMVSSTPQAEFQSQGLAVTTNAEEDTDITTEAQISAAVSSSAEMVRELEAVQRELADLRTSTNQHIKTLESENRYLSSKIPDKSDLAQIHELQEQLLQAGSELDSARLEINTLADQLTAADERAQFAETRTEDFFQRFAKERKRAAELAKQLTEANAMIVTLTGKSEGNGASLEQARLQIARLERVRDVLISERDRALKERDEARAQVSRLDMNLKSVNAEYLSTASRLKQELQQLESSSASLVEERDRLRAECDAAMARIETLEELEQQTGDAEEDSDTDESRIRQLESLYDEVMSDCDRLRTEQEQERVLYHDLERENQALSEEKNRLMNDLQSVSARMMELETILSDSALVNPQRAETIADNGEEEAVPVSLSVLTLAEESFEPEAMAGEDLLLILRIESALQESHLITSATLENQAIDSSSQVEAVAFDDVAENTSESPEQVVFHSTNSA